MKELELTLRIRNNRLKERREQLGMNQVELARAAGVPVASYCDMERMRSTPRIWGKKRTGQWRKVALDLAAFHCVEPEELFPPAVEAIEQPVAVRRVDAGDLQMLLSRHQEQLAEGPGAALERREFSEQCERTLFTLPPREATVLRLRFGWDGSEGRTYADIGEVLGGLSTERVRQLEQRALRFLRHPSRSKPLAVFHDQSGSAFGSVPEIDAVAVEGEDDDIKILGAVERSPVPLSYRRAIEAAGVGVGMAAVQRLLNAGMLIVVPGKGIWSPTAVERAAKAEQAARAALDAAAKDRAARARKARALKAGKARARAAEARTRAREEKIKRAGVRILLNAHAGHAGPLSRPEILIGTGPSRAAALAAIRQLVDEGVLAAEKVGGKWQIRRLAFEQKPV